MQTSACQYLDDYLGDGLTGPEREHFVRHLSGCVACHQAVQEHERLTSLLQRAVQEQTPVPETLVGRIEAQLRRARRRALARRVCYLSAAALIAVAVVVWALARPVPPSPPVPPPVVGREPVAPGPDSPDPRAVVAVRFQPASGVIALPMQTENPNVTIIWVYPTVKTDRQVVAGPSDPDPSQ